MSISKKIGIKLFDDSFVPVLDTDELKNKRVELTTVRDNQDKAIIELYEGTSDKCINNEYLGKLTIPISRETEKGAPAIEVHLRLDDNGMLYARAWDKESGEESEVRIEHSQTERIFPETLSDQELSELNDNYDNTKITSYDDDYIEKGNGRQILKVVIIIILILLILSMITLGTYFIYKGIKENLNNKENAKQELISEPIEEDNLYDEELFQEEEPVEPKEEIIQNEPEITGKKDLTGKKHFIRRGDNLWNICKKYYADPWYYPDLAKVNNIKNPRLIYTGQYITIPDKNQLTRWQFKN